MESAPLHRQVLQEAADPPEELSAQRDPAGCDSQSNPAHWHYTTAPNPNCCKNGSVFSAARCPSAIASSAR